MSKNKNSFLVFINDLYFLNLLLSNYLPFNISFHDEKKYNVRERIANHQTVTFCIERHSNTGVKIHQKLEKRGK